MSLFCFCAGILSLAYYVLIVVYAGITADFAWFWVLLTAVLEGSAVLIRYEEIIREFSWMAGNCDHGGSVGRKVSVLDLSAVV